MSSNDCVLLIEPRESLRQALLSAIRAEKIVARSIPCPSLEAALQDLRNGQHAAVIFLSNRFAHDEVLEFVSAAKNTDAGRDAAFILLLDQRETHVSVARQILKGMDGFLSYPFNIESVQTTLRIALGVKAQRLRTRVQLASRMVLGGIREQLDHMTYDARHRGKELGFSDEAMTAGRILRAFGKEEIGVYFEVLFRVISEAKAPVRFVNFEPAKDIPYSSDSEIQEMLMSLESPFFRLRLSALTKIESRVKEMAPYVDHIRRRLKDPSAACRRRAASIVAEMERADAMKPSPPSQSDDR